MVNSRFLNLIKTKQIGGSNQVSADELDAAADSVFLEPNNLQDLLQIGHINAAIQNSRQNNGIPKGSLSQITSTVLSDSPTTVLQPTNEEVFSISAMTIKESSGSTATVTFALTDGSSFMQLGAVAGSANQETAAFGPLVQGQNQPLIITSGSYLVASRDNECTLLVSYNVLQS